MLAAYSVIIEALPCLSSVPFRFLSLTGEDPLANLTVFLWDQCLGPYENYFREVWKATDSVAYSLTAVAS